MSRTHLAEADITGTEIIDNTITRSDIKNIKCGIYTTGCVSGDLHIPTGLTITSGIVATHHNTTERTATKISAATGSAHIRCFSAGVRMSSETAIVNWTAYGT